jgi:hypothetical protein
MENILQDRRVYELLEKVDRDLALKAQEGRCEHCGGALHRGDYPRKPRGGPGWEKRYSYCCSREGCRKRKTPPSVRFLGRKVYVGVVVVLVSAMMQGLSEGRVKRLRQALEIDRRTLGHWREWWMRTFVAGCFLESGTGSIPASGGQGANAFGFGGSLWGLERGRSGESDEVSLSDHDEFLQGSARYVMVYPSPQRMPLDSAARSVVEVGASFSEEGYRDAREGRRIGEGGTMGALSLQCDRAASGRSP